MSESAKLSAPRALPRKTRRRRECSVDPVFPLVLLETMRDMDRPEEVLEDEDLSVSLPRRLGLSDVVGVQIRRLQEDARDGTLQRSELVEDLFRLVIRRPDAEEIFIEAGRRVARSAWEQRPVPFRTTAGWLPRPLARVAAHRAARKLLRQLVGPAQVRVRRWPVEVRMQGSLTARADSGGVACAFYTALIEEFLGLYTGRPFRGDHNCCEARGGGSCQWTVQTAA